MEVGTVPTLAPDGSFRGRGIAPPKGASDGDLVGLIRAGNASAFEALDVRYRAAILSFCRQILSDRDEAEDAVQHTFFAAYTGIVTSAQEIEVRPWLYAIARNRCYSILRARREVAVAELEHGTSEEPAALVQRREELRDLMLDVRRLPEDQRAALVMAELGAHSHDEIAGALEVPRAKVKALVFQARASLVATKTARETDCADIRRQLRSLRGAALRRGTLRRHLLECPGCCEYRRQLRYQRTQFAAGVLPLGPLLALKSLFTRATVAGRTAPAAGGVGTATAAVKLGALKPVMGAIAAMLSAASAVVAVHQIAQPAHPSARTHAPHHAAASPARAGAQRHRAADRAAAAARAAEQRLAGSVLVAHPRSRGRASRRTLGQVAVVDSRLSRAPFRAPAARHTRQQGTLNPPPVRPKIGGTAGLLTLPLPTASPPTVPNVVYGPQNPPNALPPVPPTPPAPPTVGPGDPPGDHGPPPGDPPPGDHGPGDPPPGGPGDHGKPPVVVPPVHHVTPPPVKTLPPVKTPPPVVKTPTPLKNPVPVVKTPTPVVKTPTPVKVPAPPVKAPVPTRPH